LLLLPSQTKPLLLTLIAATLPAGPGKLKPRALFSETESSLRLRFVPNCVTKHGAPMAPCAQRAGTRDATTRAARV
jgi:hypothetical protein